MRLGLAGIAASCFALALGAGAEGSGDTRQAIEAHVQ
jgi:hypothetical protein